MYVFESRVRFWTYFPQLAHDREGNRARVLSIKSTLSYLVFSYDTDTLNPLLSVIMVKTQYIRDDSC